MPPSPITVTTTKHGTRFRSRFFVLLLLANASRFISIIIELFLFNTSVPGTLDNGDIIVDDDAAHGGEIDVSESNDSVVFVVTQTVPALLFASNYSLLVLFVATLATSALKSSEESKFLDTVHYVSNGSMYLIYCTMVIFVSSGGVSASEFQIAVYILIAAVYFLLGLGLCFFAPSLLRVLKNSPIRSVLMTRLITLIGCSAAIFFFRSFLFTLGAIEDSGRGSFLGVSKEAEALTYLFLELLPSSLLIAVLISRKYKNRSGENIGSSAGLENNSKAGYGTVQERAL